MGYMFVDSLAKAVCLYVCQIWYEIINFFAMFIGCVTIDLTIVVLGTLISVMSLIVPELYIKGILLRNF